MTEFEFQIENFMLYCTSKNLARKTLASYEQSLKLFAAYLRDKCNRQVPLNKFREFIFNN